MKLGIYQHYKGKLYDVLGIARHSESLSELVVYRMRYGNRGFWVRPRKMFEGFVKVQGKRVKRFTFLRRAK
ncbi:MAG: DUF1653 domain-containing protein [Patescibacteria group bacterium]